MEAAVATVSRKLLAVLLPTARLGPLVTVGSMAVLGDRQVRPLLVLLANAQVLKLQASPRPQDDGGRDGK